MSLASRILAQRSSVFWSVKRQVASARLAYVSRRGYASAHDAAQKTGDMPWLLSSVGVTVVGLAYLVSGSPTPSSAHGPKSADASAEHHQKEEQQKEASPSSSESESKHDSQPNENHDDSTPGGAAGPKAPGEASQSGQNVAPPSVDGADPATKGDEKKQGHEELKETARAGETKVATSSSAAPSKKSDAEDPREDPQKGEGEVAQKGSSKN
ncbi:hypothetical protein ANO14919_018070 [Xylariales sp. No.14919]|nr:hypothetical protein F5X98DRAFT_356940 [Xylaria grammica]GAW12441.1 hypothetical protein ANO14919_018070 [Xylariales sp. No.14919]